MLTISKGFPSVSQQIERQESHFAVELAVWETENIIESRILERHVIFPANIGIHKRSPRHREWMHAILMFELMSHNGTILATASRNDHVITSILRAIFI